MKRILILNGSPRRKGNTAAVAEWVAEGARQHGADVDIVEAMRVAAKFPGCIACMGCQRSTEFKCVIKDDVAALVARIPDYDVVVFASPVYFMSVTAQLKIVMDRMYSLIKYNPVAENFYHNLQKTRFALIVTAGGDANGGMNLVLAMLKQTMDMLGKSCPSLCVPNTPHGEGEILSQSDLKNRALQFGAELLSNTTR